MPELKFCLRDWTRRSCKIRTNWCVVHRCPIQSIYIDDRVWEEEYHKLRDRGIPEAHISMHMLRNRVGEFIEDLPMSTFSLHLLEENGGVGEWKQSFTDLDKACMVANDQIAQGSTVILIDDYNGETIVKSSQ